MISNRSPDCVAVTETWLSESHPSDVLTIANYTLFRADRAVRKGGGACIYVHDSFKPKMPNQVYLSGSESILVHLSKSNVLVWCLYIPPNLTSAQHCEINDKMTQHLDTFLQSDPNVNLIICGDFNDYDTESFKINYNCINKVNDPTRGNSALDQIWISESLEEKYPTSASVGPPLGNSDHCCALLYPSAQNRASQTLVQTVFDYRTSHIERFLRSLGSSDFSEVYLLNDADTKCNAFCSLFLKAFNEIPRTNVIFTQRDKPWITPLIKKLIQDRWDAYRSRNWPVFRHLKSKVRSEIHRAKKSWSDRILKKDKHIWNIVRDLQGKNNEKRFYTDADDLHRLVNAITKSFKTNFNSENDTSPCLLKDEDWEVKLDPISVFNILYRLRLRQSPGNDAIPALLLRKSADLICKPLCDIFRSCIESRTFPSCWKEGIIRPIAKVKNPSAEDFRPITLLPILSKVLEKIVLSSMKSVFIRHFGDNQHAFRPRGSSTSALIHIHDTVTSFMEKENNLGVRLTCFDFCKAFDKLQHNRLVNHLKDQGLNQGFLLWLRSFLCDRYSRVSMSSILGSSFPVTSGVPQGSVLGPYLFAMFVSTINTNNESARLIKFADDLTLVESLIREGSLSNSLETIVSWSKENNMPLNSKKCKQMLIKKNTEISLASYRIPGMQQVTEVQILGVTFSDDLKWKLHFKRVTLAASRRLHLLRCLRVLVSKEKLFTVFRASVLAVILYASPLFGPLPHNIKYSIEKIAKRAHRIICGPDCDASCIYYVSNVSVIREKAASDLLLKCENPDHPLHCIVPPRMSRSNHFRLPHCKTSRRLNSFFPYACSLVNSQANRFDL